MKWFSETNVRNFLGGHMSKEELLALGCSSRAVVMWDDPVKAAEELANQLLGLPDSSAFGSDFGLVATQNRSLILWALRNCRG